MIALRFTVLMISGCFPSFDDCTFLVVGFVNKGKGLANSLLNK